MNEITNIRPALQTCSSNMLSVLKNLERMFMAYRYCVNADAGRAILFGMGIEAQTLALKMKAMLARWNRFLPFHEVIDVRFEDWQKTVSEWIEMLGYTPSEELIKKYPWLNECNEYMLDLYALTEVYDEDDNLVQRDPEFYKVECNGDYQRELSLYMEKVDDLLAEMFETDTISDNWHDDVTRLGTNSLMEAFVRDSILPFQALQGADNGLIETIGQKVKERFDMIQNFEDVNRCVVAALSNLQNQLCDLQALFNKALSNDQFIRLSTRLFYRHCLSNYREGEAQVNKWQNNWPEAKHKTNAKKKKDELKKMLAAKPYGTELSEYIDMDAPNLFTDSSFGRFLFKNRHELKVEDLQFIHMVCREINLLSELIGETPSKATLNAAPIRQLTEQEQQIVNKLKALIKRGNWEIITEETVMTGLGKALGLGAVFTDKNMAEMSNSLWEQLKKRRGCDAEKSLMVGWLNIVGYCVKKGFLSGGSPALCKQFFPKCHADDYKAIDKGRTAEVKSFRAIIPLLDACFK